MFVTTKSGRKIKLPNDAEDAEITRQALADGTYLSDEELAQLKPVRLPATIYLKSSPSSKIAAHPLLPIELDLT